MTITLYKNQSEPERVVKTLIDPIQMTGTLRDETSVQTPTILVNKTQNITAYNYMYVPEFGRYYYITDITSINRNLWAVDCKVDVLQSYAAQIKNQTGIIERQENSWNLYINDPEFVVTSKQRIQTKNFPNSFDTTPHYVLILVGRPGEEST